MDIQFFKKLQIPQRFGIWSAKSRSVVGVDIGTSSVKIVQLKKEKERAILETYGSLSVGPYAGLSIGQAAHLSEAKAIEMVGDLLKEAGVKAKDAAVSISLRNTFITTIELPAVSRGNLADIVSLEARRYIPLPISEVILDWWAIPQILGSSEEGSEEEKPEKREIINVLLVAIYKEAFEAYKSLISKTGLKAKLFEIEIFSAIRSSIGRETSPLLVVDMGASVTKMAIVDYGVLRLVHTIDKGSQDLTLALSSSLGVDFRRAEEMKQEIGFSTRPEHKEISSVIEPIMQFIFSEISRFIGDYRKKSGHSVSRVIISGGGGLIKGIIDLAVKNFGVEVVVSNPFSKIEYPALLQTALKEIGPAFSTAIGLALRGLQEN